MPTRICLQNGRMRTADHLPAEAGSSATGVGISSSVIPYVTDQLAMARLPRASFALLLSILPATATAIGFLVLKQVPTVPELIGIGLVIVGVALHRANDVS